MRNLVSVMRACRAKTVLISSSPKPIGIELSLRIPARETVERTGKIATCCSQGCIRFILNCIYGEVYFLTYDEGSTHKRAIDEDSADFLWRLAHVRRRVTPRVAMRPFLPPPGTMGCARNKVPR